MKCAGSCPLSDLLINFRNCPSTNFGRNGAAHGKAKKRGPQKEQNGEFITFLGPHHSVQRAGKRVFKVGIYSMMQWLTQSLEQPHRRHLVQSRC